jgi:hypothetical protein
MPPAQPFATGPHGDAWYTEIGVPFYALFSPPPAPAAPWPADTAAATTREGRAEKAGV